MTIPFLSSEVRVALTFHREAAEPKDDGGAVVTLFLSAWACSLYWTLYVKCCDVFHTSHCVKAVRVALLVEWSLTSFVMKISASILTNQSISMLDKLYKTLYINYFYHTKNES